MTDSTKSRRVWGADVPISMPEPLHPDREVHVDMEGFCFTTFGIAQNFKATDLEEYRPTFAPPQVDNVLGMQ